MRAKLTLTMEGKVISSAKKYAKRKNTSLSAIVENYLKFITEKEVKAIGISPRVLKLMGSVQLPEDFDYKNVLADALAKKY